ncbi:hypothetical protein QU668_00745 [Schaalia sp. HMT-877]|nr:hypothetical protein QU668_00745 [Schaalia sp. HMT-877]
MMFPVLESIRVRGGPGQPRALDVRSPEGPAPRADRAWLYTRNIRGTTPVKGDTAAHLDRNTVERRFNTAYEHPPSTAAIASRSACVTDRP